MQVTKHHIEMILSEFIITEFGMGNEGFSCSSNLFEGGYVDSIHLETFFGFIEQRFDVLLREDLFFDERITSISGIADIVLELREVNT
jgi:acyl carrier protein